MGFLVGLLFVRQCQTLLLVLSFSFGREFADRDAHKPASNMETNAMILVSTIELLE